MAEFSVMITGEYYVTLEADDREDAVDKAFDLVESGNGYFKSRDVDVEEI